MNNYEDWSHFRNPLGEDSFSYASNTTSSNDNVEKVSSSSNENCEYSHEYLSEISRSISEDISNENQAVIIPSVLATGSNQNFKRCKNCKGRGHFSKDCKKPINSYGIIALRLIPKTNEDRTRLNQLYKNLTLFEYEEFKQSLDENEELDTHFFDWNDGRYLPPQVKLIKMLKHYMPFDHKFLLIQRKHSIDYEVIIRGKYKKYKLPLHIDRITDHEKEAILRNLDNFEDLWNELWHNKSSKNYEFEKNKAQKLFKNQNFVRMLLDKKSGQWLSPSWGFPKGRRYNNETDRQCAIREFMEETNLGRDDFKMVALSQFFEKYTGSNDTRYSHKYYLAIVRPGNDLERLGVDPTNTQQVGEIGDIGWFTFEEAFNMIRDYHVEKKRVLLQVNNIFQSIKN